MQELQEQRFEMAIAHSVRIVKQRFKFSFQLDSTSFPSTWRLIRGRQATDSHPNEGHEERSVDDDDEMMENPEVGMF